MWPSSQPSLCGAGRGEGRSDFLLCDPPGRDKVRASVTGRRGRPRAARNQNSHRRRATRSVLVGEGGGRQVSAPRPGATRYCFAQPLWRDTAGRDRSAAPDLSALGDLPVHEDGLVVVGRLLLLVLLLLVEVVWPLLPGPPPSLSIRGRTYACRAGWSRRPARYCARNLTRASWAVCCSRANRFVFGIFLGCKGT